MCHNMLFGYYDARKRQFCRIDFVEKTKFMVRSDFCLAFRNAKLSSQFFRTRYIKYMKCIWNHVAGWIFVFVYKACTIAGTNIFFFGEPTDFSNQHCLNIIRYLVLLIICLRFFCQKGYFMQNPDVGKRGLLSHRCESVFENNNAKYLTRLQCGRGKTIPPYTCNECQVRPMSLIRHSLRALIGAPV